MKISDRQRSLAHSAQVVLEWRAKGWSEGSVWLMLRESLYYLRRIHPDYINDARLVLEIADGYKCA